MGVLTDDPSCPADPDHEHCCHAPSMRRAMAASECYRTFDIGLVACLLSHTLASWDVLPTQTEADANNRYDSLVFAD